MKSVTGYFIFFILIAISFPDAAAQDKIVTNVTSELGTDSTRLVIRYDLNFPDTTQLFDVELKIYYRNKLIQPREEELTGSWGRHKVKPGKERVILWDLTPEMVRDVEQISAEVIATKSTYAKADFDFVTTSQIPPFEVKFSNKSVNSDKFSWEFGDTKAFNDNFSSLESPVHQYRSEGNFNVSLISANTKNNTSDTLMKVVSLVKNDEIRKHKNLKTIWLTSATASAGIGIYGIIRHNSLFNEWKEKGTDELEQKYKTYKIVGIAGIGASAICISQVIMQSKKIREAQKKFSFNVIPLENGLISGISINF